MKKVLIISLMILILITGCGKNKDKKAEKKEQLPNDTVILEGITYKLDQEDSEYGIKYKIANNFRKSVLPNAVNYFSEKKDGQSYFVIRIYYYKNKDIEYAIKDSVESYEKREEVKVGDRNFTKVYFTNYNGAKTHLFYYEHNNSIYTFVFTAGIDLSRLENIFLNNVLFE